MLTKALLTGGILSVLAGSIVYFGTEGAVATEHENEVRVEYDTLELAGDETVEVTDVDQTDPPKTKWLDQYLKSDKTKSEAKKTEPVPEDETDSASEIKKDSQKRTVDHRKHRLQHEHELEQEEDVVMETDEPTPSKKKISDTDTADSETKADPQDKTKPESRTREEIIRMMNGATKRRITDPKILERARKDGPGSGFMPSDMMQKQMDKKRGMTVETPQQALPRKLADYDRVLQEARKLQITDMRDQALLEVIDYAIDRGDMGEAADIISELSTPELRDTARSRIGKGLAQRGNADAAFAVLDEIEIDELAAPIRLEIIAALMETRQERSRVFRQRRE